MRILLINPNTSEEFTQRVQKIADRYAFPGTTPVSVNPRSGPKSIESVYDELLSSAGTLASMYVACMLGYKFSIVTTNEEWEPLLWDAVRHYGLSERCASVRSTHMPVLALEEDPEDTYDLIAKTAKLAVEEDGAEVICLGCAGMAGLDKHLEKELDIPVVDGVVCALKLLEGFVSYGVKTSKLRAYAQPEYKPLIGFPEIFQSVYRDQNQEE
jgi:allantoin racemase